MKIKVKGQLECNRDSWKVRDKEKHRDREKKKEAKKG